MNKWTPKSRYNSYGRFLKEKFGCRVYKVSVDGGFTCPNRDGTIATKGCIYCDNSSFRPPSASKVKSITSQLSEGIRFLRTRYRAEKFIAYFQPFSNTHAPLNDLIPFYETALSHPDIVGLAIGTRPDCVDEEKLSYLEEIAARSFVTLEYGLQSVYDSTLERINRGHDFKCWFDAMNRTRNRGIWLCTHLILGFPWESREEMVRSADIISGSKLNFLKLHHLHVVSGTELARIYKEMPFALPTVDDYAGLVADFIERLAPSIYIERLFGTAPESQLIAPLWGKGKAEIQSLIERKLEERDTWQGKKFGSRSPASTADCRLPTSD